MSPSGVIFAVVLGALVYVACGFAALWFAARCEWWIVGDRKRVHQEMAPMAARHVAQLKASQRSTGEIYQAEQDLNRIQALADGKEGQTRWLTDALQRHHELALLALVFWPAPFVVLTTWWSGRKVVLALVRFVRLGLPGP